MKNKLHTYDQHGNINPQLQPEVDDSPTDFNTGASLAWLENESEVSTHMSAPIPNEMPTREELATALDEARKTISALEKKTQKLGLSFKRIPEKGDAQSLREGLIPILDSVPELSVIQDPSYTDHVMIESDNLTALAILAATKGASVDVHYLDPPYNTGDDGSDGGFVYNDRFVSAEDPTYHSAWLSFMLVRLILLRETLRDTGVILVAIGDDEEAHLRLLMNEVFGQENFIARVNWAGSIKNDARFVSNTSDYMFVFAKNKGALIGKEVRWRTEKNGAEKMISEASKIWARVITDNPFAPSEELASIATKIFSRWFKDLPIDSAVKSLKGNKMYLNIDSMGRVFQPDNLSWPGAGGPKYDVLHPITHTPVAVPSSGWRYKEASMNSMIAEGRILFGATHSTQPRYKRFLSEVSEIVLRDVIDVERTSSTKELAALIGKKANGKPIFNNPKDINVLAQWIDYVTPQFRKDESSTDPILICDVFAGSGSTGHAVFKLNADDPTTHRKVILVTNNEDPTSHDDDSETGVARDVTIKRLRAALTGKWFDGKDRPQLSGNLHYYRTGWVYLGETIDPESHAEDMQEHYAGLAALASDAHNVLPMEKGDTNFITTTDGSGKVVVVWQDFHSTIMDEDEIIDALNRVKATYPAEYYVICIPAAGQSYFEHNGWKVESFPTEYLNKLGSVLRAKLIDKGALPLFVVGVDDNQELAKTTVEDSE